ncbi:hypothetical protein [Nocardia sputi]|uniref:hypothetical protein n=1 Tax=Nocardia sputi TaxID=2943705 RepID=UPI0018932278|nr:hypothetical protein [Nocardia sputi]MBF6208726.1 hypothetical protein [Streptomyces gardneri]
MKGVHGELLHQLQRMADDMIELLSRRTGPHLHDTLGDVADEFRAARGTFGDADEHSARELEKASEGRSPEHTGAGPLEDNVHSPPRLIDRSIPGQRYYKQDTANPRLHAEGKILGSSLFVSLRTKMENGQRSTLLSGEEQFQAILKFFEGKFTSIVGNWQFGSNLAGLNELTAKGLSLEAAAARTWTGKQAAKAGFGRVEIVNVQGSPGEYTSAMVEFTQ